MTFWLITTLVLLLFGAAAFSIYRAFQSPKFVMRLTKLVVRKAVKAAVPVITKPLAPGELEKAQHDFQRGHGDDYWRKRSGAPPKG